MKIRGRTIQPPKNCVVVIPRDDGDIPFEAKPVLDWAEFDSVCPEPKVPVKQTFGANGATTPFPEHPEYIKKVEEYSLRRMNWLIIESLSATEGLEWETINRGQPETWGNYRDELQKAGFSNIEISRIIDIVLRANGLNQERIDEATKAFLATREALPQG